MCFVRDFLKNVFLKSIVQKKSARGQLYTRRKLVAPVYPASKRKFCRFLVFFKAFFKKFCKPNLLDSYIKKKPDFFKNGNFHFPVYGYYSTRPARALCARRVPQSRELTQLPRRELTQLPEAGADSAPRGGS